MRHSTDKPRDMARSILPSRWRGAAKTRAQLHRAARRGVRAELSRLEQDAEAWDDGVELDAWVEPEVSMFVNRRRSADKLNPFIRWATRVTAPLPLEHRLGHLRAVLPRGLIGDHALTHLERRREFHVRPGWTTWRRVGLLMDRGEVAQLLRELIARGGQWAFNEALRKAKRLDLGQRLVAGGPRRLTGIHDVRAFVGELSHDRVARQVVDDFCEAYKATRDPMRALAAARVVSALPTLEFRYVRA